MPLTSADGWRLLFHATIIDQLRNLTAAATRARAADPEGYRGNANVRTLASITKLVLHIIPEDPGRREYRLGNTLGADYRHWCRAKFNQRFRLFFRYDSRARVVVYAWVNDTATLRARGGRNDPYLVFRAMLDRGDPPDGWERLLADAGGLPPAIADSLGVSGGEER